jgi:GntR family carbon starvation induced transcriptional regulator
VRSSRPRQVSADYAAYDLIREDLLAGCFEPEAKLRVEALCERYGLGTSPIREALSRLAESGLITYEAQRGYRVAPVSIEEYADLVAMRLKLEPDALARSVANGDISWEVDVGAAYHRLSRMHEQLKPGSPDGFADWTREDQSFHLALISACRSPWLIRLCTITNSQIARYQRDRTLAGVLPVEQTRTEHKALMEAALARDAERSRELLTAHITAVANRLKASPPRILVASPASPLPLSSRPSPSR